MNAGDGYQTVTIVPSETGTGEVSYVLIVQQPEDGKDKDGDDADLSNVYDFDEGEEGAAQVSLNLQCDELSNYNLNFIAGVR